VYVYVCVCWLNIRLCLTPETDYVGGLPSIERDKTDLDVARIYLLQTENRETIPRYDAESILSVDAFEIAK